MSRTNETDLSSSVVSFLVGTPYSWETFSKRLSAGDWQDEALRLAEETSEILTAAAKLFGMLADDFPGAVPPAVRANFIENAGTKEQPKPQDIVDSIKAYETYGLTYGTDGWQGLVKTFLDETKHDTASIDNFAVFLEKSNIVFQNVKLANHGGDHAATATEKTLDSIFTEASIFSVP